MRTEMNTHWQVAHLIGQDLRVNHIGRPCTLLVFRQEDLDILTVCGPGECHIQLSMREDRDSKVNSNTRDRLTLGFVDGD